MLKLFTTSKVPTIDHAHSEPDRKLSRFEPRHVREITDLRPAAPVQAVCRPPHPDPKLNPAARRPSLSTQKFNDAAHLHCDGRVSITVLRRALPQRFAQMASY